MTVSRRKGVGALSRDRIAETTASEGTRSASSANQLKRLAAAFQRGPGKLIWGTPRSHQVRSVPIPRFLVEYSGLFDDDLDGVTERANDAHRLGGLGQRR